MQVVDRASNMAKTMSDTDEFLKKVLEEAQAAFGEFNFVFFEIDRSEEVFKIKDFKAGYEYMALEGYTQSLEDGLLGRVYKTRNTWVVRDARKMKGFIEAPNTIIGAEISSPVMAGEEVFGILTCVTPRAFDFKSHEVWVVKQLAEILGRRIFAAKRAAKAKAEPVDD
jgi:putative methionine-R-sulfoxide reductase with GAF domain